MDLMADGGRARGRGLVRFIELGKGPPAAGSVAYSLMCRKQKRNKKGWLR